MLLYIKNMVCSRCIMVVEQTLDKQKIPYKHVGLGEVELENELNSNQIESLNLELHRLGFSIIDDRKHRIIEKIKNLVVKMVHTEEGHLKQNVSVYLSEQLHLDYNYLSSLFSEIENTTIEKYIISQKIERAKELLVYDELTLNEIAFQLGYSSAAHLSNQFKKVTGLTPGYFKKIKENKRTPLDEI